MHQTGKVKATELGGLAKCMPFTCFCCIVGAASISAFPFFSGFASKSIIMTAAADGNYVWVWLALLFASAGVFHHAGIKIPFFVFFSHDGGHRVKEAPINMRIAMGIAAFGSIAIGCFPQYTIYPLLPFDAPAYEPYTVAHVMGQSLLLLFSALAFTLLMTGGIYPSEIRSVNIDTDWFYRKGGKFFYQVFDRSLNAINAAAYKTLAVGATSAIGRFAADGPARLILLLMNPYWTLIGKTQEQRSALSKDLKAGVDKGAFPIGITAWLSVLVLALLFFF